MSHIKFLSALFGLLVPILGSTALQADSLGSSASANQPSLSQMRAYLSQFERWAYGLEFEAILQTEGTGKARTVCSRLAISRDGNFARLMSDTDVNGSHKVRLLGNSEMGWCFTLNQTQSAGRGRRDGATIEYLRPGQLAAAAIRGPELGFVSWKKLTGFFDECACRIVSEEFGGKRYVGVECDHPSLQTTSFFFDAAGRLKYYSQLAKNGDLIRERTEFGDAIIFKYSAWAKGVLGPIEYAELDGRPVVSGFKVRTTSAAGGGDASVVFSNHRELRDDALTDLISFPDTEIENGMRVTSKGQEELDYEFLDGRVVLRVDGAAMEAAAAAKMSRRQRSDLPYYSLLGGLFFVALFVAIWYRNRDLA